TPAFTRLSLHDALPICPPPTVNCSMRSVGVTVTLPASTSLLTSTLISGWLNDASPSTISDRVSRTPMRPSTAGAPASVVDVLNRSEEHTSELQSPYDLV